ncbi:tegument protein UL37 [Felid alphaherpesvirus 1]|uniref:Tegument protein UL37 n=1 Tax=Feline herpesvirus 1 TaxID=10334 RepID=D1FXU5_FHV1|nr:tegument protein UL37 [Felid alphaherpesvirus 1]AMN88953.1 tegument protein UL37 [synthetic construct]ACT88321.2 tegument protein UL37 [Felid alphaherpesvirus 1]ALJ84063.1 tegument protein UL37 [Felid alphaherpesvirus 1]ALJ84139.1 tegument protein UL37 [Felid alphaherpesvirus 1]ALJ84215.1 tegument protein UL37 [Felid alphaherpesvirus 1]
MDNSGPLMTLVASLEGLVGVASDRLTQDGVLRIKSMISEFFLSTDSIELRDTQRLWAKLQKLACDAYLHTRSPETAFLAENLPGLIFWRFKHDWTESPINDLTDISTLLDVMNDEECMACITTAGLRVSSFLGPSNIYRLVSEWIVLFKEIYLGVLNKTPSDALNEPPISSLDKFSEPLVSKKFELLYGMPFVQEGLRVIAIRANWLVQFGVMVQRTRDSTLTPLTRALYMLALVDEYFQDIEQTSTYTTLVRDFLELTQEIDEGALVPLQAANLSPRTAYEVRISSAIAHQNPFITNPQPGTVTVRLRTDPEILTERHLNLEALLIHVTAIIRLLDSKDITYEDGSNTIWNYVVECTTNTWEVIQASTNPHQAIEALIQAGFTSFHCSMLERAISDKFSKARISNINRHSIQRPLLDEAQQAIGCVAMVGSLIFKLVTHYGNGLDYIRHYTTTLADLPLVYGDLLDSLGLPNGSVEQIIRHCMAPKPYIDYITNSRVVFETELNLVDQRVVTVEGNTHNAARESLLMWFDFKARDLWGIQVQYDAYTTGQGRESSEHSVSEVDLLLAAIQIEYPSIDGVPHHVLSEPAFTPYLFITVVLDALHVLITSRFSGKTLIDVIKVCTWARDYGIGVVANVDGYRTKLTAIINVLNQVTDTSSKPLTVAHVDNLRSLMVELHSVVTKAVMLVPEGVSVMLPETPSLKNSTFLAEMYLSAILHRLKGLIIYTAELGDSIITSISTMTSGILDLKKFFSCRFSATPGRSTLTIYPRGVESAPAFGVWRLTDIVDAVGGVYCDIEGSRSDIRAYIATLRSDMKQTSDAIRDCETMIAHIEGSKFVDSFKNLLTAHSKLTRIQTGLLLRAGKLLVGSEVPSLKHLTTFLGRWRSLSSRYTKVTSTADNVPEAAILDMVIDLQGIWNGIQHDKGMAPPIISYTRQVQEDAVLNLLGEYSEVLDDGVPTGIPVTGKSNIASWDTVELDILRKGVIAPNDIDVVRADEILLTKSWVTPEDLLAEVDSIFNVGFNKDTQ